jgi:hypothetical protein
MIKDSPTRKDHLRTVPAASTGKVSRGMRFYPCLLYGRLFYQPGSRMDLPTHIALRKAVKRFTAQLVLGRTPYTSHSNSGTRRRAFGIDVSLALAEDICNEVAYFDQVHGGYLPKPRSGEELLLTPMREYKRRNKASKPKRIYNATPRARRPRRPFFFGHRIGMIYAGHVTARTRTALNTARDNYVAQVLSGGFLPEMLSSASQRRRVFGIKTDIESANYIINELYPRG